jgi:hypothetical protein
MTDPVTTRNITATMTPWVEAALTRFAPGEDLRWETAVLAGQQAGSGVLLGLVMFGPSPVLGQTIATLAAFSDPLRGPQDETAVTEVVRNLVEQLRQTASAALSADLAPHGAPGRLNGS